LESPGSSMAGGALKIKMWLRATPSILQFND
jgi:hypothetical protein